MIHRTRTMIISISMILIMQLSACITTPVTVTSSNTPVHDKKIISNQGPVRGSHSAWSVFSLWMVGRPDIDLAIQDALKKKGGDALINISCYEKTGWFFFVSKHTVVVEGEAVTFEKGNPADSDEKSKKDYKARKR